MAGERRFRYILRYLIAPGFHEDDRIQELVAFCKRSQIEEVMFFITPEELSAGHPTDEELDAYIDLGKRVRDQLDQAGIAMSVNPWTTTYHVSRGRTMRQGQNFTPLVGETGDVSRITACPLCPQWQDYLCRTFTRMAKELNPTAIWVEDDWRLHNHEPEMNWGGCFCDLHLQRFEKIVGQPVTREQVLAHVLAKGEPHPWRQAWLDLWRETLLEPAVRLRDAMAQAAPGVRLGLMSSVPDVHSAEGRDWHRLQEALGAEPAFLTRPHLPPYTETGALETTPTVTRQTIANLKRPLDIYPELENSPRNGQYTKSATYSMWECLHAAMYGSHGITINHYDMMGNGITLDPAFGDALAREKQKLNAIVNLGIDDTNALGLQVLFHPDVAASMHTEHSTSINALVNRSATWSRTAYILGISHGFTQTIDAQRNQPIAVSGQTLRAFDDDAIKRLLSGPVVLDALSVDILIERGYADWLGIQSRQWHTLNEAGFAYEHICEDDARVFGLANPRMTAQRCAARMLHMQAKDEADVRTWIYTADHRRLFPGLLVHRNDAGGTIGLVAYPFDEQAQFYMGYFNVFRRQLMQRLLFEIAPEAQLVVGESHPLHVYATAIGQGYVIGIFNPIYDIATNPQLRLSPSLDLSKYQVQQLDADGQWRSAACQWDNGRLSITADLLPLQPCILRAQ